jgi:Galactose oxidase, central domain
MPRRVMRGLATATTRRAIPTVMRSRRVIRSTAAVIGALALLLLSTSFVLAGVPGTWTRGASMTTPRFGHSAVLLPDGKVLVVGGTGDGITAELFDPVAGRWSATGRALTPPGKMMVLPNGKVLGAGEVYDPAKGTWSASNIPQGVLLPDNTILVDGNPPTTFDLQTGRSTPTAPHAAPGRVGATLTLLLNGKVLLAGGADEFDNPAPSELYEPTTRAWSVTGLLASGTDPLAEHSALLLADGRVLVAGGEPVFPCGACEHSESSSQLYDPVHGTWSQLAGPGYAPNSLTLLPNGQVLTGGGQTFQIAGTEEDCTFSSAAELFDPISRTWGATGSLLEASGRPGQAATLLNSGTVLVTGGARVAANPFCPVLGPVLASTEIYTPPTPARLPTSCPLTLASKDPGGHAFIRVAARDITSGLQSVKVVQASNASVALPQFPPATRDPAVVTATRVNAGQPSTLKLSVTNRAGTTITCDPVMTTLVGQRDGNSRQVFTGLAQNESHVLLQNDTAGVQRVDLYVNGRRFRLDDLKSGDERTLDVSTAMRPGEDNIVVVKTKGPQNGSAMLVISDSAGS